MGIPKNRQCSYKFANGNRCGNWRKKKYDYCGVHLRKAHVALAGKRSYKKALREAAKIHDDIDRKFKDHVRWVVDGVSGGHLGREDAFELIRKAL